MILLETGNRILYEEVLSFFENQAKKVDTVFADFDGCKFNVKTNEDKSKLLVSISFKATADLLKHGGSNLIKTIYGAMVQGSAEPGYDMTLAVPATFNGNKTELATSISLFKRNLVSAPFLMAFSAIEAKKTIDIISVDYRSEETFYIKTQGDNVIVVFDIHFKDADDIILSKIFLQSFVDARKTLNNTPAITFSQKDPPLELKGVRGVRTGAAHGFVSFVLFPAHLKKPQETADLIQTFRDYLHYHIKCAKGYMHTSMRNRLMLSNVLSLVNSLNRIKIFSHTPPNQSCFSIAIPPKTIQKKSNLLLVHINNKQKNKIISQPLLNSLIG
ncbi:actin related protein 2/3 complex [Tieghemostelium lacteum]|uniref:Arp2/3 complex 34 kDa subunit n=1 Tax=Tieghemostelium lacteum TaxID=361077 RepID=A0A152A0Q5_TIELA|nr:actin related protein 2/3 complex [Tieghemostelium lacteum]|eukprot:KYQ99805.1 actin related protein 2/3 complex [Tieghemostelium lacteum]